jgi:2-iminobutanoate/2-iminopropanoate deaminase
MTETARAWTPVNLPGSPPAGAYSPAVRVNGLLFVSGQVPRDPVTGQTTGTSVREQTRQVMANVARVLDAAGATLDDIVSVTAYLADIHDWEEFNQEYRALLSAPYPSRTTVGAGLHGFLVEISVIAVAR